MQQKNEFSFKGKVQGKLFEGALKIGRKMSKAQMYSFKSGEHEVNYLLLESKKKDAETIVIIHGFSDSPESFLAYAGALRKNYNIVMPFLPGFNDQGLNPNTTYNLDFYKQVITDIFEEREIEKAHVMGHSLGGAITFKLYESSPNLFLSLTAVNALAICIDDIDCVTKLYQSGINPFEVRNREDWEKLNELVLHNPRVIPRFFAQWIYEHARNNTDKFSKIAEDLFEDFRYTSGENTIIDFSIISVPTHLIWGELDQFFPLGHAKRIIELTDNSKLHIIEGSGHCPHMEKPKDFLAVLKDIYK